MTAILSSEVRLLATVAATIQPDYESPNDVWLHSPFAWIRTLPSRQRGAVGEKIVSGWLAAKGFDVTKSPDSDADRCVEGKRVEVKFSTLWKSGVYKFQQLRDQRYDFAICIGISPFDAHCWVIEKPRILHHWHTTCDIRSQHGGKDGRDTAWISVKPARIDPWLHEYGGSLADGLSHISRITGYIPK